MPINLNDIVLPKALNRREFLATHETGKGFSLPVLNALEQQNIALSSYIESIAEVNRQNGSSGLFSVRQYNASPAFKKSKKVWDTAYSALNMHNHPNYRGMPGCSEFSAMINGYYIRTRHNDYRSYSPVSSNKLKRKEIMPPSIPPEVLDAPVGSGYGSLTPFSLGTQYEYMKNIYSSSPKDCIFYLSYVEVWLEKYSNANVGDNTDSFRHVTDAASMRSALEKALVYNATGHKNLKENIPYQPIFVRRVLDTGEVELAVVRYRINVFPVASLANTTTTKEFSYADGSKFSTTLKPFGQLELEKGIGKKEFYSCSNLASLCSLVPGIDGLTYIHEQYGSEHILEFNSETELNAAYYNNDFSIGFTDAAGRRNGSRGFNDPNLFTAKTTNPDVIDSVSYMIPYELVLRTPRENWNPDNLPLVTLLKGGSTLDDSLKGVNPNKFNFMLPIDLFKTEDTSAADVADTRSSAWVLGKKYYASGINIIDYDSVRRRYAVAPNYHDYSKASCDLAYLRKELEQKGIL